ncbi:hypothetical protein ACX8XN_03615 [Calditrichota bacterium GD2]
MEVPKSGKSWFKVEGRRKKVVAKDFRRCFVIKQKLADYAQSASIKQGFFSTFLFLFKGF